MIFLAGCKGGILSATVRGASTPLPTNILTLNELVVARVPQNLTFILRVTLNEEAALEDASCHSEGGPQRQWWTMLRM